MRIGKINTVLLTLTVALQGVLLYQIYTARPRAPEPVRNAPDDVTVDVTSMPSMGSKSANAFVVEFSDYECPFCRRHATGVLKELRRQYVDTGKVRYVFANNPLKMHQSARLLARGAICAGQQEQYWDLHDRLFESESKTADDITRLIDDMSLERSAFHKCMGDEVGATKVIDADVKLATGLGLLSTPSFAVGTVDGGGRARLQKLIVGAQPLEVFQSVIDDMLDDRVTEKGLWGWLQKWL